MDTVDASREEDRLAGMQQAIDHALKAGDEEAQRAYVRLIVRRFDVDFDVPLKHERCLGLLTLLGATERRAWEDEEDRLHRMERLAGFLGAATCRIVRADLAFEWMEGLRVAHDSRGEAELLERMLEAPKDTELPEGIPRYAAYSLARWLDAAGKINYRLADYTTAEAQFERALGLARRAASWSCEPDFESNLERARMEALRTTTGTEVDAKVAKERAEKFRALETRVLEAYPWLADPSLASGHEEIEVREGRRGLSNILHNKAQMLEAVYRKTKDDALPLLLQALETSRRSLEISKELGDAYRIAQSELLQGRLRCERPEDYEEGRRLFDNHRESKWRRGRPIAEQWLARMDHLQGRYAEAAKRYEGLIARSDRAGDDVAQDIASQTFTLRFFQDLLNDKAARRAIPEAEIHRLELIERAHRLRIARAVRDVVKLARYKEDYAAHVLPAYLREIARRLEEWEKIADLPETQEEEDARERRRAREDLEESVFVFSEEVSARELLDAMAATATEEQQWFERQEELLGRVARLIAAGRMTEGNASGPERTDRSPAAATRPLASTPRSESERSGAASARSGPDGRRSPDRRAALTEDEVKRLRGQQAELEREALRKPLRTVQVDPEILHSVRMFLANEARAGGGELPHAIVRFLPFEVKDLKARVRAHVIAPTASFLTAPLVLDSVLERAKALAGDGQDRKPSDARAGEAREVSAPPLGEDRRVRLLDLAKQLHSDVVGPILQDLRKETGSKVGAGTRLVFVPTGPLLTLPLHAALGEHTDHRPLAAFTQVCFSVSATAYVQRGRYRLGRFPRELADDLFAFVRVEGGASGGEIRELGWDPERFQVQGSLPGGMSEGEVTRLSSEADALRELVEVKPELFLYSGHGMFDPRHKDLGPVLDFGWDPAIQARRLFSQVDVARRVRLPRNKLTLLAACVTGLGADKDGGEVGGFLRAFMAAGSGAIGLTLWNVLDSEAVATVGHLLKEACPARLASNPSSPPFDVLHELRAHYARRCDDLSDRPADQVEACPIALYL